MKTREEILAKLDKWCKRANDPKRKPKDAKKILRKVQKFGRLLARRDMQDNL